MPKFNVEYGYPITQYSNFEVEADSLVAAEIIAIAQINDMNFEDAYIDLIEEIKS